MRGLYRYETSAGRWWACAADEHGARVNIPRQRYEQMAVEPPFEQLPVEREGNGKSKRRA